jgi:hypothetical protein
MRRVLLGLAGFLVIALIANTAFADDEPALKYSLDLNKLFGSAFEGEEEKAKVTCGGWGQFRFAYSNGTYSFSDGRPVGGDETFQAWRFRFLPKVVYKWLSFGCQYETASTLTLLDFWSNIKCPKFKGALQMKLGQFIPPFGLQRPISPYKIRTINYSQVVAYLFGGSDPGWSTWGNLRDTGVMFHGTKKFGEKQGDFQPSIYYALGFFTGEAANTTNSDPAFTTFFTAKVKAMKGILIGLSYEDGSRQGSVLGSRNINRDRFGICYEFDLGDLLIYGEYIVGNMNPRGNAKHEDEDTIGETLHNKQMDVDGAYFVLAYFLSPKKFQVFGKIDWLDVPAWNITDNTRGVEHTFSYTQSWKYAIGFNVYINKHCRVQVVYEWTRAEGRGKIHKIAGSEERAFVVWGVNF